MPATKSSRSEAQRRLFELLKSVEWTVHFESNMLDQYACELDARDPVRQEVISLIQQVDSRTLCPRIRCDGIWYQSNFWNEHSFGGARAGHSDNTTAAARIDRPDGLRIGILDEWGNVAASIEYHMDDRRFCHGLAVAASAL